jgi:hypothetical protein
MVEVRQLFPAPPHNVKQTEVDFGDDKVTEKSFTITDADVSPTSQIVGTVAYEAPTGKDVDEVEMDSFELKFRPGSGSFVLFMKALEGSVYGKFKINYLVG